MSGTALNDSKFGVHRSPKQLPEWGRFAVLTRTDGKFAVYDPELPLGKATVVLCDTEAEAAEEALACSVEATARGESNVAPRLGYKYDWNDPKVWDRFA